jgi:hypothetical protein
LEPTQRLKEKSAVAKREKRSKNASPRKSKYTSLIEKEIIRKEA